MVEPIIQSIVNIDYSAILVQAIIIAIGNIVSLGIVLWFIKKYFKLGEFLERNVPQWIDKISFAIKERRAIDWANKKRI